MERAYKFRIYPNQQQKVLLAKTFGCVRFVYNYYLDKRIKLYKESEQYFGFYDCCKDLTTLKEELEWLKEVDSHALQRALKGLESAYKNFFRSGFGFPKFKSRKDNQPLEYPSAGSTFRNLDNQFSWQLIDSIGYRGKKIGGAQVSEKHSNFIINVDNASAMDVIQLTDQIKKEIKEKYNLDMIMEVERFNW